MNQAEDATAGATPGARDEGSVLDGLIDLASARLGGRAVMANDEFFAPKERLLEPADPVFEPDRYTDRGKWMDGWETRRRRTPGHDWCIIELAVPGRIRRVVVETTHFRGNHPESCSLEAAPPSDPDAATGTPRDGGWREILSRSPLAGDSRNEFGIEDTEPCSRVRLNIFPDGGVARLRVLGEPTPDWSRLLAGRELVDLAAALHGGVPIECSDRFFSDPGNLLMPGPSTHMGDGWETRRRRGPGHDWVVVRLGRPGVIEEVEVDTSHFKGNYPAACSLEGLPAAGERGATHAGSGGRTGSAGAWHELLSRAELGPDAVHRFTPAPGGTAVSHVRFNIYPDGGVARLRLHGRPVP